MDDETCRKCQADTGERWPLAGHEPCKGWEEWPIAGHGYAFGMVPTWREIPGPLSDHGAILLAMHNLASERSAVGGMGGIIGLGIGYLEREACFRYYGITDSDIQEYVTEAFEVIGKARSEGESAGDKQRKAEEK